MPLMQKQFRIPLIFFFVASCIGLLLRFNFVFPLDWLQFPNWLHAHSHTMFLGWVFNTLFLAYISNYSLYNKRYDALFIIIQTVLIGMLISFPLQGYGIVSIVLSALHTVCVFVFCWRIFKDFKNLQTSTSIWFAKVSLILFILSTLGPFTLGPLVANGLGQTKWYYFSVYYYLHFQYNGVFIFGVLSLFFQLLEERGIQFNLQLARRSGLLLLISFFPTYALSTLWAEPGLVFNIIGFVGALIQLLSLYYFLRVVRLFSFSGVNRSGKTLLMLVLVSYILKCVLQLLSAHPFIAELAFNNRPFVIAYLHLVLIGVVTFFLLFWYLEKGIVEGKLTAGIWYIIVGFVGSEFMMILSGTKGLLGILSSTQAILLFIFSVLVTVGAGVFLLYIYNDPVDHSASDKAVR